ncbi:hypothetical protein N7U66_20715 [Lacinutrix neustonica]|uniref:Uncharacterized protein n=1 Tax=Lacinutrix neustonica TaxID=2980107 RepID=A0A9E8SEC0_9FLAO|nr:hypothetical protein [Lacinutrix neustonica]WAC02164.1 hypothetical protein N7U66_20715 [Lacinutrix neustonica]
MEINNLNFGVFKITEANVKPIIAKKDEGKDNHIKNGEIYFRYGGRTQKIRFPNLNLSLIIELKKTIILGWI